MNLPHAVVKVTPARNEDRRGDTVLDYGEAATRADIPAWVQRTGQALIGREDAGDLDRRTSEWVMFCEDPTLDAQDRIEWRDLVFAVDGRPDHLDRPTGYHHTEAQLSLTEV